MISLTDGRRPDERIQISRSSLSWISFLAQFARYKDTAKSPLVVRKRYGQSDNGQVGERFTCHQWSRFQCCGTPGVARAPKRFTNGVSARSPVFGITIRADPIPQSNPRSKQSTTSSTEKEAEETQSDAARADVWKPCLASRGRHDLNGRPEAETG